MPLIERHFEFDPDRFVVIDPNDSDRKLLDDRGVRFVHEGLTRDNYRDVLTKYLTAGSGQGFCVNLSVDTSSLDLMRHCREIGALYVDTVVEPWPGFYYDKSLGNEARTNYALARDGARGTAQESRRLDRRLVLRRQSGHGVLVRQAGAGNLAKDLGDKAPSQRRKEWGALLSGSASRGDIGGKGKSRRWSISPRILATRRSEPKTKEEWARLAQRLGVKGVHIAERDTQRAKSPKPRNVFVNTWSVEGFLSEGMQPAELGWGAHEKWAPDNAGYHKAGCGAAIYINQPGANTRVRSWTPTARGQFGFLVTHNESISIADYYTVRDEKGAAAYRPTCHYAYHPCDDAVLSLHELFGRAGEIQSAHHILGEAEILDGIDELGVLLYGHARNAYWYGSQLSVEETRALAPYQNATGMQVTSAVLAGMVWALENPKAGIVEADELDFRRCLEVQTPYLGPVVGVYTDWTPLAGRPGLFPEDIDQGDPWQFRNVLVR